jgi:hypothetical protein
MSLEDRLYPLLPVYQRMPNVLKQAMGWSYRQLPTSFRLGARYGEFRRLTEETASVEDVQGYQQALCQTLIQVGIIVRFSATVRQVGFSAGVGQERDDLRQCPLLTKQD